MHCRTSDQFWSQLVRPFIFVPAAFLGNQECKSGNHSQQGENGEVLPGAETLGLSAASSFFTSFPFPSKTGDLTLTGHEDLPGPAGEKRTGRRSRRKTRAGEDAKGVRRAEDIAEYKGQMSVDDLLVFINNGKTQRQTDHSRRDRTTRNKVTRSSSGRRVRRSLEALEVTNGKLCDEISTDEEEKVEGRKRLDKSSVLTSNADVCPEDAIDLDTEAGDGVAPNEFTIVSRRRKGKTRMNREASQNEVNSNPNVKGSARVSREISPNKINLTLHVESKTIPVLNGKNSPNKTNLTSKVNQHCPQEVRTRNLISDKQSKAVVFQEKFTVSKLQNSSAQHMTSNQSRDVTATTVLDATDAVDPAIHRKSKNGGSISSQKESQDEQTERGRHSIHQTGVRDHENISVSLEKSIQSLSGKFASCRKTETKGPASKSGNLRPPVVFTDRNRTAGLENPIDVSFGFDSQDADLGHESANCIGSVITSVDRFSESNSCRCGQANVNNRSDDQPQDTKSQPVPRTNNFASCGHSGSDEMTRNITVRSGTCGDPQVMQTVPLPNLTTYQHDSISRNGRVERGKADSTTELNRSATGKSQSSSRAKENTDRMFDSDKIYAQPVNCIASSKKCSTVSVETKRITNSIDTGVISADFCTVSLPSTCRPISIVAPNQMLCSSDQSSSSLLTYSENRSSVKNEGSSQHICSSLVPSSSYQGSNTILGPCVRAPVVKVAPMLAEKLVFNPVRDVHTNIFKEENPLAYKSNSHCEDSTCEGIRRYHCNTSTEDHEGVLELSLLTEACECDVAKLEACPFEHDYKVQMEEVCYEKQGCDVNTQSLHNLVDCEPVKERITFCPTGNAFDLLSAQLYLYKSYLDSLSDPHEVYEDIPEICQEPVVMEPEQ